MELTVVFGGLLSVSGLYALLTREQAGARSERPAGIDSNAVLDQLTSRTGTGYALTLTGLLILIAVASRPAVWWGESILDGPVPTGVYWFGTLAALAPVAALISAFFCFEDVAMAAAVSLAPMAGRPLSRRKPRKAWRSMVWISARTSARARPAPKKGCFRSARKGTAANPVAMHSAR